MSKLNAVTRRNRRTQSAVDVVGCSVIGPDHEENETPCQDDWHGEFSSIRFIFAVADGLGSAPHAEKGSELATHTAVQELKEALAHTQVEQHAMRHALKNTFTGVRTMLQNQATRRNHSVSAFGTTLLVVVAGPAGVAAAAVGDGGIVYHRDNEVSLLVPRERDIAPVEFASETIPVTSDRWTTSYRFGYRDHVDAVAAFTDGIDPFAWDLDTGTSPRQRFFKDLFAAVETAHNREAAEQAVAGFLTDEYVRSSSRGDKTIAIGTLPAAAAGPHLSSRERRRPLHVVVDRLVPWLARHVWPG